MNGRVSCDGCGAEATGMAVGWHAAIMGGYEDEPLEVTVFCPTCFAAEFSGPLAEPDPLVGR